MTYFFELNGLNETWTILKKICRRTFIIKSSIFSELHGFSSFLRIQENLRKRLKTVVISKLLDQRSNNFQENRSL